MGRKIGLAHLTLLNCDIFERIRIASRVGYDMVGLRLVPVTPDEAPYPIMSDPKARRDAIALLADVGLSVFDVEYVRLTPEFSLPALEEFIACAAEFSAKHILVVSRDPERSRAIQNFAALCQFAQDYGLTAELEFSPWTCATNLDAARMIVDGAGQDNGGIIIDAIHVDRCHVGLDEIRALPSRYLRFMQLCDAPGDYDPSHTAMVEVARKDRLLPGEGGIDCTELLGAMPADLAISVEAPNARRQAAIGAEAYARAALEATRRCVQALPT